MKEMKLFENHKRMADGGDKKIDNNEGKVDAERNEEQR